MPNENTPPLLQQIAQSPLLIDCNAESLFRASIEHIVRHEHAATFLSSAVNMAAEDEDFWPRSDDWRTQYRPYVVKNGILQIPVMGVLLNRFPWQLGRWATGYSYIEKAWQRGMADANVKGIAYIHDSPGGEVAGNFELADKLFASRRQKPQRSFAADHSYSASYSLSSAPGSIAITRSGGVGSIGVVTAHVEYSKALDEMGVKVTFIFAGKHKVDGNPYEKLPDGVKSRIQERIDRIYGVFTSSVARNRAMDESKIRATEALTYDAEDAIKAGLADRVGSLEEEMVVFSEDVTIGDEQMANDNTDKGIPQATHDKAVADATLAGEKKGEAAAKARIIAILGSDEAKTRQKAAMSAALKTDMTVEQAKAFLADLPEEKAEAPKGEETAEDKSKKPTAKRNHFEEAMGKNNPEVGAGDDGGEGDDKDADMSNSILKDYAGASGIKRKVAA
jgi:signal peptide peptidase SppA